MRGGRLVGTVGDVVADTRSLIDLVAHLRDVALCAESRRIHGIDADVGAVGRVDHAEKQPLNGIRNGEPFREEHQTLAAG